MSLIASLTSSQGLRRVLWLDAASGAGMGLAHLGLSGWLAAWLGYPPAWLLASGLVVLPFALLAATLARRTRMAGVRLLAVGNFAWVAVSAVVLFSGVGQPTALGQVYVLAQAAFVLLLAELQWTATRRTPQLQAAH